MEYLLYYLLFINILGGIIVFIDKNRAKQNKWRISEKTLFVYCFLGGSIGVYISMKIFRHKTKHKRFMIGIPCILIAQITAIYLLKEYFFR